MVFIVDSELQTERDFSGKAEGKHKMEANQGVIVLVDQAADHGSLRSVLYDWGYTETEINRFLNENEMSEPILDSMNQQVYANAD